MESPEERKAADAKRKEIRDLITQINVLRFRTVRFLTMDDVNWKNRARDFPIRLKSVSANLVELGALSAQLLAAMRDD